MPKRGIATLEDRIDPGHLEIDEGFAEDLPLQIRCERCSTHLLPQLLHGVMFFRHPTAWPRECVAARDFRVTASYILLEVLAQILDEKRCVSGTIREILRSVLFVTVEPTKEARLRAYLNDEQGRAA